MRMQPLRSIVVAALLIASCSDDVAGPTSPASSTATSTTAASPGDSAATTTTEGPGDEIVISAEIRQLDHPLMAELVLSLADDVVPVVRLVGPNSAHDVPAAVGADVHHTILLAGMRAETTYAVEIRLLDATDKLVGVMDDLVVTTGPLPGDLPVMTASVSDPDRMAPGLTLFNLLDLRDDFAGREADPDAVPPPAGWIFVVDEAGEIVWYHNEDHPIGDVRMLDDGTILFEFNDTAARRINLRGDVLEEWAGAVITGRFALDAYGRQVVGDDPVVVDVDAMHHEQAPLPDGTHVTLSTELRVLDGFTEPQCGEDPANFDGTYHLIGDVVVIFDPLTGKVLEEFSLFDYFDPRTDPASLNLCGLPFDFVFPNWLYRGIDDQARDWTHANGVEVDEASNTLIISIRHLDAVIGLRWKDDDAGLAGELLWHSGPSGDLELVSGEWHLHQHAPELQSDGTLLLYDNGNGREGLGTVDAPLYSRAVRFDIVPGSRTVEQVWEYRSNNDGDPIYAGFVGDADGLANGNVLVTDGGVNGTNGDGLSAQLVEVIPTIPQGGDVVFRFEIEGGTGWIVYRSERIPSIYG